MNEPMIRYVIWGVFSPSPIVFYVIRELLRELEHLFMDLYSAAEELAHSFETPVILRVAEDFSIICR